MKNKNVLHDVLCKGANGNLDFNRLVRCADAIHMSETGHKLIHDDGLVDCTQDDESVSGHDGTDSDDFFGKYGKYVSYCEVIEMLAESMTDQDITFSSEQTSEMVKLAARNTFNDHNLELSDLIYKNSFKKWIDG